VILGIVGIIEAADRTASLVEWSHLSAQLKAPIPPHPDSTKNRSPQWVEAPLRTVHANVVSPEIVLGAAITIEP
jgi:hypothetical protein